MKLSIKAKSKSLKDSSSISHPMRHSHSWHFQKIGQFFFWLLFRSFDRQSQFSHLKLVLFSRQLCWKCKQNRILSEQSSYILKSITKVRKRNQSSAALFRSVLKERKTDEADSNGRRKAWIKINRAPANEQFNIQTNSNFSFSLNYLL